MARPHFILVVLMALSSGACIDSSNPLGPGADISSTAAVIQAAAFPAKDSSVFVTGVQLRPGVTVDLHLQVFVDETWNSPTCTARDAVLAVAGFAHTAATWRPYAEALFQPRGRRACAVIALDLPGHGDSGLPNGITFGDLMLDDYVTALLAVLESLFESGRAPATLVAHSQGGLVIQMAQQLLVSGGASLWQAAGVREVQLLAPVPAAEVPWSFAQSGLAAQVLGPLVTATAELGVHASVPAELWPVLFFSDLAGQLAPGAPSAAAVAANGFNAPAPLFASLQLIGAPPFARPSVARGIFGGRHGSQLSIVTFEQDQLIRPSEGETLLRHLVGDDDGGMFSVIEGAGAVHDLHVSDPRAILRGARSKAP